MASTESRNVAAMKYFIITPVEPSYTGNIARMVIGGILILVGLVNGGGFLVLLGGGGLYLVGSGLSRYLKDKNAYDKAFGLAEPKPSDEQMDNWLSQDKQRIASEAMDRLELVSEKILTKAPLIVLGPLNNSMVALGKDKIYRFSKYKIVVIYLTEYHLGAYSCILDFINGRNQSEETQEYHYKDVVSVSTRNTNSNFNVILDGKETPIASQQQFSLSVASGEKIEVTTAFPQLDNRLEDVFTQGNFLPTGAENAISTLRTMLREKKGGL